MIIKLDFINFVFANLISKKLFKSILSHFARWKLNKIIRYDAGSLWYFLNFVLLVCEFLTVEAFLRSIRLSSRLFSEPDSPKMLNSVSNPFRNLCSPPVFVCVNCTNFLICFSLKFLSARPKLVQKNWTLGRLLFPPDCKWRCSSASTMKWSSTRRGRQIRSKSSYK